jgi:hypothetical protein
MTNARMTAWRNARAKSAGQSAPLHNVAIAAGTCTHFKLATQKCLHSSHGRTFRGRHVAHHLYCLHVVALLALWASHERDLVQRALEACEHFVQLECIGGDAGRVLVSVHIRGQMFLVHAAQLVLLVQPCRSTLALVCLTLIGRIAATARQLRTRRTCTAAWRESAEGQSQSAAPDSLSKLMVTSSASCISSSRCLIFCVRNAAITCCTAAST